MSSYYNKIKLLVFLFITLTLLVFSFPLKTYAYSGQGTPAGPCESFTCGVPNISDTNRVGSKQLCRYDDPTQPGLVGYQTNSYSSNDCNGGGCPGTFGFCPSQCHTFGLNTAECGQGICANGGATVSQICNGDAAAKNAPMWCVGAYCGTKCDTSTYSCVVVQPGTDYQANPNSTCSTASCQPSCKGTSNGLTYQCVNGNSCAGIGYNDTTGKTCASGQICCYSSSTAYSLSGQVIDCANNQTISNASLTFNLSNGRSQTGSNYNFTNLPAGNYSLDTSGTLSGFLGPYSDCNGGSNWSINLTGSTTKNVYFEENGTTCSCSLWSNCSQSCNGTQTRTCTGTCPNPPFTTSQACNVNAPTCTPPPPGPVGSCTILTAYSTGKDSGHATVSVNGFDRLDWKLNDRIMSIADIVEVQNGTNSHDFTNLSSSTNYKVTATGWCQNCGNLSSNCLGQVSFDTGSPSPSPNPGWDCWAPSGCSPGTTGCDVGRWLTGDPGGRIKVTANFNLPGTPGYKLNEGCYRQGSTPDPPQYGLVGGKIWVVDACTPVTTLENNTANLTLWNALVDGNILYWVWSIYGGPMCSFTNGDGACQLRSDNLSAWLSSSNQILGRVDSQEKIYANNSVTLLSWDNIKFKPTGYYRYQGDEGSDCYDSGDGRQCRVHECKPLRDSNNNFTRDFWYWGGFACDGCIGPPGGGPSPMVNGFYPNPDAPYCLVNEGSPYNGEVSANGRIDWVFERKGTFTVTGTVYRDDNKDGIHQASETTGIPDATVTLSGFTPLVTGADGIYSFSSVPNGSYTMSIQAPEGYLPTNPSTGSLTLSVGCATASPSLVVSKDLLLRQTYDIWGFVKNDENLDGTCTASDRTFSGTVSLQGYTQRRPISLSGNGRYSFDDLSFVPGSSQATYRVTVNPGGGIAPREKIFTIPPRHISPETDFCISVPRPFVETQNGDVHSNTKINLPKGPPISTP